MKSTPIQHTGEQPAHRPPEEEPERVGEGELDIGPSEDSLDLSDLDEGVIGDRSSKADPRLATAPDPKMSQAPLVLGATDQATEREKENLLGRPRLPREDLK